MEKFEIIASLDGRLDKVLALLLPNLSREYIKNLIISNNVMVNGSIENSPAKKIKIGSICVVEIPKPTSTDILPVKIPIDIIYEDEHLAVINKQAGFTVHPGAGNYNNTLVNALLHHFEGSLSVIGGVERPGIVHRIDKNTSGLIVVAKNDITHKGLANQFSNHTMDRAYRALVYGIPNPTSGVVNRNILRHATLRTKMTTSNLKGKPAITNYKTLFSSSNNLSLLECRLQTGRTHQIRVHMLHIGHPLVGDTTYFKPNNKALKNLSTNQKLAIDSLGSRQALHAYLLGFIHPITMKKLSFEVPEPSDLLNLYQVLEIPIDNIK